jgi:hypothetical protein
MFSYLRLTARGSALGGRTSQRNGKMLSPKQRLFRGAYHQVRLHALLGNVYVIGLFLVLNQEKHNGSGDYATKRPTQTTTNQP